MRPFYKISMRHIGLIAVLITVLYAFSGATEIDEQVFAINAGIDRLENGRLRLTVQMPSGERDESGSGGSAAQGRSGQSESLIRAHRLQAASRQSGYIIATADGINYPDAVNIMTATLPRLLNMSQVKQVIVSRELAQEADFSELIKQLIYDNEFHHAAQLVVCEGRAEDFLHEQKLMLGARLSKAQDAAQHAHLKAGFMPSEKLSELYYGMNSGYRDGLAALCGVNTFDASVSSKPDASGTVFAGRTARTGVGLNEYMGSALFDGGHMVGRLTGYETQLAHILSGTLRSMLLMENGGTAKLMQSAKPRITVDLSGAAPDIAVRLKLSMKLHQKGIPVNAACAKLEAELSALVRKCQALSAEPFGFGTVAVRQFLTFDAWNQYGWRQRFANADIHISVEISPINM